MGITATRSSTTEPMLVGDAFTSSCGAARGARNLISRDRSALRSGRGLCASSPDVPDDVLSAVWLWESASNEGGVEVSSHVSQTQRRLASMRQLLGPRRKQPGVSYKPWYCPGPGRLGFYNNWFVTKISWWLEDHRVAARAESSRRWRIIG